jgi:hypothetical protein
MLIQVPQTASENSALLPKTKIPAETESVADEVQKRIADLKRRPVPTETGSQLFHYDPSKPLHLASKLKKSET